MVHPNDHVNAGQSTNDVIPTAGKTVRALVLEKNLLDVATLEHVLSPYEMTEVSGAKVS